MGTPALPLTEFPFHYVILAVRHNVKGLKERQLMVTVLLKSRPTMAFIGTFPLVLLV